MFIFIKGALCFLDYFIDQISDGVKDAVFLNVMEDGFKDQLIALDAKIDETTYVITFNNLGVNISIDGHNYWDCKHVKLINYMVDAAWCFTEILDQHIKSMLAVVVDREHQEYLKKYYPDQKCIFLPHGGFRLDHVLPFRERKFDMVYFGYRRITKSLETDIEKTLYDLLIKYPRQTVYQLMQMYLDDQKMPLTVEQEKNLLYMLYLNVSYKVKEYYQANIVRKIGDAGIKIHVYGGGWDKEAEHLSDNVILHGAVSPQECMEIIRDSKIVLNFQPMFKNGAHERIFNAMLNGAVCCSDESKYLKERFVDMENIVFYQPDHLDEMIDKIQTVLCDEDFAESIIYNQKKAVAKDTWRDRLDEILTYEIG